MSRFISRLTTAAATAVLVIAGAALAPIAPPATAKTAVALPSGGGPNSIMRQSGGTNSSVGVGVMCGRDGNVHISVMGGADCL